MLRFHTCVNMSWAKDYNSKTQEIWQQDNRGCDTFNKWIQFMRNNNKAKRSVSSQLDQQQLKLFSHPLTKEAGYLVKGQFWPWYKKAQEETSQELAKHTSGWTCNSTKSQETGNKKGVGWRRMFQFIVNKLELQTAVTMGCCTKTWKKKTADIGMWFENNNHYTKL